MYEQVSVLSARPPSRASPLPHLTEYPLWNAFKCGSGLAREEATSVSQKKPIKKRPRPEACGVFPMQPPVRRYADTSCTQGQRWSVQTPPAHFPYRRRRYRCI
ncbi:hypothetical protein DYL59_19825 [Pseudomonas kairouanensis]|uniref:Uncharacterized protein n=1 Tax=Pseudomonas kairouanensis TaxID=2293832 RepID=A0A4Z0AKS5_9PSED|nr:hypothetical protein DYL59_19825 [Pseudomonas kairouanensis]